MKEIQRHLIKTIAIFCIFAIVSCSKKEEKINGGNTGSKDFKWSSELKITDIPDAPLKGTINGKEVSFAYINFETWRGSGDHVLNFGDVKPKNNCGYIESDNSFHLMHKGGEIKTGDLIKASFDQNLDGYTAYFSSSSDSANVKTSIPWNCALVITSMDDKTVKGKIAMCFNNDARNWIAGSFEAIRCYN